MAGKLIKAHCVKHDKWFVMEVSEADGTQRVVNFAALPKEDAKRIQTEAAGTSFCVSQKLRRCSKCGTDKVGTCPHMQTIDESGASRCAMAYSYQCVFCDQLRISDEKANADGFTKWAGVSNIPDAMRDRFGNPEGDRFDLAADGACRGKKIAFLCVNRVVGERIEVPINALKRKGFEVDLIMRAPNPKKFEEIIKTADQIWVLGDSFPYLSGYHRQGIREFYDRGGALYIWGCCKCYTDANRITRELVGTEMKGDVLCDKVIGVQSRHGYPGVVSDHPIAAGIESLYEGYRIAVVEADEKTVKPLVIASTGDVVVAYVDDGKHRMLIDGCYSRLDYKWDTAGTERFLVNCAAWLAGETQSGEKRFT